MNMSSGIYQKIAIIGFGHIGRAIADGLIKGGIGKDRILTSSSQSGNAETVGKSDLVFICVKPESVREAISSIAESIGTRILISVAACVDMKLLEKYSGQTSPKIVRLMPNIPVAYGEGVVGYYANKNLTVADNIELKKIISGLGYIVECKNDDDIDRIGMISGSGTGYAAFFMDILKKTAVSYGFGETEAEKIVFNTFSGTVTHIKETGTKFDELVAEVATRGGITEEVIKNLVKKKYPQILKSSVNLGYRKIKKIKKSLKKGYK